MARKCLYNITVHTHIVRSIKNAYPEANFTVPFDDRREYWGRVGRFV